MRVEEALELWDEFPVRREPRLVHADGLPVEVVAAGRGAENRAVPGVLSGQNAWYLCDG